MSFLSEIKKQKTKLKETDTVVTNIDGSKYMEGSQKFIEGRVYGFVVDTQPDDVPVLVVDHVYIGSQDCAEHKVTQKYNIQRVLSLGIEINVHNINNKFIYMLDLPESDIICILKECLPFIHGAVETKENILIHCNAGVSRTAAVAIGYLMQYHMMEFEDAYKFVKVKRPAIQPNIGFKKQLKNLNPGMIL